jgi:hypothetical protein
MMLRNSAAVLLLLQLCTSVESAIFPHTYPQGSVGGYCDVDMADFLAGPSICDSTLVCIRPNRPALLPGELYSDAVQLSGDPDASDIGRCVYITMLYMIEECADQTA